MPLAMLVAAVARIAAAGEVWLSPRDDGMVQIRTGMCAPAESYRMWGAEPKVAAVLNALILQHGDDLTFATWDAAAAALDEAVDGRLQRLLLEERDLGAE